MRTVPLTPWALTAAFLSSMPALANLVAYDIISNYSSTQFQVFVGQPIQADDTTLDAAAVRQSVTTPDPGSTSPFLASGNIGDPVSTWGLYHDPDRNYAIRIETVPAPASVAAIAIVAPRRRRRNRPSRVS